MKNYVLIVKPVSGIYGARIMNYDVENKELSRFLSDFDVWRLGSHIVVEG